MVKESKCLKDDTPSHTLFQKFDLSIFFKVLFVLIIVADFYLSYRDIGPYPPRNYITAFLSLFVFLEAKKIGLKQLIIKYDFTLLYLATVFSYVIIFSLINGYSVFSSYLKDILKYGTLIFSLQLLLPTLTTNFIKKTFYTVCFISLFFAVLQDLGFEWAWKVRDLLDPVSCKEFCGRSHRPAGLAYFSITLSEQLMVLIPFLTYELFLLKRGISKTSVLFLAVNILFFITVLMLNSRSTTLALFSSLFYVANIIAKQKRIPRLKIALIFCPIVLTLAYFFRVLPSPSNDTSRIESFIASLYILKDNFFMGLGPKYHNMLDIFKKLQLNNPLFKNFKTLGQISPHNYFINLHISLGLMGTMLNIYSLKRIFLKGHRCNIFLICILINSLTHNAGFYLSSASCIGLCIFLDIARRQSRCCSS